MTGDRELLSFRQGYYELFVSLFWKGPDGELLLRLSDGIEERIEAARNLHPLLAEGWEGVRGFFNRTPAADLAETVAEEYTRLFIGPHELQINPYESFYFTGRTWDRPLAELRTFLKAVGIEKQDGYPEPEDFLAFELEVMRWLVGKQAGAADRREDEKPWIGRQAEFLRDHLLVWAPACAEDITHAKGAGLYREVAKILLGFLELERTLCREWGVDRVTSLEQMRLNYGAMPNWKGPTFDMKFDEPEAPSPPKGK